VFADGNGDVSYRLINAAILGIGVGLNRLGHRLRVARGKVPGAPVMRPSHAAETIER
jgi:hypothetical protein